MSKKIEVQSNVTSIKVPKLDWKDESVSRPRLSRELENDLRDFFELFAAQDGILNPHDMRTALRQIRKIINN
jgi:Ca2+-binding EF-hand superfamily protein